MIYGERLRFLRERIGYSQVELAKLLNVNNDCYCHYEKEDYIIPIKHLFTLCTFLNISLDYVFSFTETIQYKNCRNLIDRTLMGNRLKDFRKEMKITQDKLAKTLNVSRTTITEYERGVNIIATPFLYEICKHYGVSADYLLGRTDSPKSYK